MGLLDKALRLFQTGQYAEARQQFESITHSDPGNPDGHHLLGLCFYKEELYDDAVNAIRKALKIAPGNPQYLNNLGQIFRSAGDFEESEKAYRLAIRNEPGMFEAYNNLGNALVDQERIDEAIAEYTEAIHINPDYAPAHYNLGIALKQNKNWRESRAAFSNSIKLMPDNLDAHASLASVLFEIRQPFEALDLCQQALSQDPGHFQSNANGGLILYSLGDYEGALPLLERAVSIDPDFKESSVNLASVYGKLGMTERAIGLLKTLHEKYPTCSTVTAKLYGSLGGVCAWEEMIGLGNELDEQIRADIAAGRPSGEQPFAQVGRVDDPQVNFLTAKSWSDEVIRRMSSVTESFPQTRKINEGHRIKLGYISSDYRNHPIAHLMNRLFELHDRDRFEVYAYSNSQDDGSEYSRHLRQSSDCFVLINTMTDEEAATRIHQDEIDILIDLNGHTSGGRHGVCALHPAPIQVSWIYPGTVGADFIDYIVVDAIIVPEKDQRFLGEKPLIMPNCYLIFDDKATSGVQISSRSSEGLPEDAFVFCSFCTPNKFDPITFEVWMDILSSCEGSVLWLFVEDDLTKAHLRSFAQKRGIEENRVIFARKLPKAEHLDRIRLADIALDTRIYNGHTTTSDCLLAGLPVITMEGNHWASRVSMSILHAAGLPELVTGGLDDYRDLAIRYANDRESMRSLRKKTEETVKSSVMSDSPKLVEDLENGFEKIWKIHCGGHAPKVVDLRGRPN